MYCYAHEGNDASNDSELIGYDYPLSVGWAVTIPESSLHGTGFGGSNIMDDVNPIDTIIVPVFDSIPTGSYTDFFEEITIPYFDYTPNGTNGTTPTGYKKVKVLRSGAATPALTGYKTVKVFGGTVTPKIRAVRNGMILSDVSATYRYFHPNDTTTVYNAEGEHRTTANSSFVWNVGVRTTPTYRF